MPLAEDVDVIRLARRFEFSGGQINVAVHNAAVAAAVRGDRVTMADLIQACAAEEAGSFGTQHTCTQRVGFHVED